jgi:hypothetical protein
MAPKVIKVIQVTKRLSRVAVTRELDTRVDEVEQGQGARS